MKKALLCLMLIICTMTPTTWAADPLIIAAKSYVLLDDTTGQIIASKAPNARMEPASLTKLMTAYIVFKTIKQGGLSSSTRPPVSAAALAIGGSTMHLDPKNPAMIDELVHGLVILSANDAALVLADAIAGTEAEFIKQMNKEAKRLGLKNTLFANASGKPAPQHYSSAYDMALLGRALMRDFSEYSRLYAQKIYTHNLRTQQNRNTLLFRDPTVDGLKTGQTASAGYCLAATAQRNGRRLYSVLMGAASEELRTNESQKLINYGFLQTANAQFFKAMQPIKTLKVYKGQTEQVQIGVAQNIILTLEKTDMARVKTQISTQQPVLAPLVTGQKMGKITLSLDGKTLAEYPLLALNPVPLGGFWDRTFDSMRLWFD